MNRDDSHAMWEVGCSFVYKTSEKQQCLSLRWGEFIFEVYLPVHSDYFSLSAEQRVKDKLILVHNLVQASETN